MPVTISKTNSNFYPYQIHGNCFYRQKWLSYGCHRGQLHAFCTKVIWLVEEQIGERNWARSKIIEVKQHRSLRPTSYDTDDLASHVAFGNQPQSFEGHTSEHQSICKIRFHWMCWKFFETLRRFELTCEFEWFAIIRYKFWYSISVTTVLLGSVHHLRPECTYCSQLI